MRFWWGLRLAFPLITLGLIWLPEWNHFRIDRSAVSSQDVKWAVTAPPDGLLQQVVKFDLAAVNELSLATLAFAQGIVAGSIEVPGLSGGTIALKGYPADLKVGPPTYRLFVASLSLERLLLEAYELTGEARWLEAALVRTVEFASYERKTWYDNDFLWNDHAVAARVSVIINLWRHVRRNPVLVREHGLAILSLALRSSRWLSKPSHFTVRTNHGVMQNLALLQMSAAFSGFAQSAGWRALALERLKLQLGFYVSPEGVVLEHSAGYQAMGTRLLDYAERLIGLNGLPVDPSLSGSADKARNVLLALLRPDGTLPAIGNTLGDHNYLAASPLPTGQRVGTADAPERRDALYAIAGWAIWWNGDTPSTQAQTSLSWAKHDGHGHKHADEGSMHVWSGGTDWITATGYWPYGAPHMSSAYGWRGANAMHEPGEPAKSKRDAQLAAHGSDGRLRFADILRTRADQAVFRRQVLQFAPNGWLVLDFVHGSPRGADTVWTVGPGLSIHESIQPGQFRSSAAPDGRSLTVSLASSDPRLNVRTLFGSISPFGGWAVVRREPAPVSALEVHTTQTDSVTATVMYLGKGEPSVRLLAPRWADLANERWQVEIYLGEQRLELSRRGTTINIRDLAGPTDRQPHEPLELQSLPADVPNALLSLRANYAAAVRAFPPWRDVSSYRITVSAAIAAAAICLEIIVWLLRRQLPALATRNYRRLHAALAALWGAAAAYLLLIYFAI